MKMKYQIEIDETLVKNVYEMDRYYNGDLKNMDDNERWLNETRELLNLIASEIKYEIFHQVPPWEPTE